MNTPDERLWTFLMAGGGTGGHVVPALSVAGELRRRGHEALFVGTRRGIEARLVPAAGFPVEWIDIEGLNRVGLRRQLRTLSRLPAGVLKVWRRLGALRPRAVFSMGGYVAGPVVLAAWCRGIPVVVMEPNVVPGMTNRWLGRMAARALLNFPETARHFPAGSCEVTGLPVREDFFALAPKERTDRFTLLVTGGSQGSRTLNRAAGESWPLFRDAGWRIRIIHQAGKSGHESLAPAFARAGLEGEVVPFIENMPAAFAAADLVVCRSGAGAVAELAAAGKPSLLVPFPFAADEHQLHNAQAMEKAGAARVVPDGEMNGERLFREVAALAGEPGALERMGAAARQLARPGAARRAADVLEELAANVKKS